MSYREENVPRGDNVPAGEREQNEQRAQRSGQSSDQASPPVEPGSAEDGRRGSAGWGSEPSGGSVIDKR